MVVSVLEGWRAADSFFYNGVDSTSFAKREARCGYLILPGFSLNKVGRVSGPLIFKSIFVNLALPTPSNCRESHGAFSIDFGLLAIYWRKIDRIESTFKNIRGASSMVLDHQPIGEPSD